MSPPNQTDQERHDEFLFRALEWTREMAEDRERGMLSQRDGWATHAITMATEIKLQNAENDKLRIENAALRNQLGLQRGIM